MAQRLQLKQDAAQDGTLAVPTSSAFDRTAAALGMPYVVKNTFIEFKGIREAHQRADRARSQPIQATSSTPSIMSSGSSENSFHSGSTAGRSLTPTSSITDSSSSLRALSLGVFQPLDFDDAELSDRSLSDLPDISFRARDINGQTFEGSQTPTTATPLDTGAERWHAGASDLHAIGKCQPCLYANSRAGCLNGAACRFCHLSHTKKKRPRPCKAKRQQCKQIMGYIQEAFPEDSLEFQDASARLSSESTYMRSLFGMSHQSRKEQDDQSQATTCHHLTAKCLRQLGADLGEAVAPPALAPGVWSGSKHYGKCHRPAQSFLAL